MKRLNFYGILACLAVLLGPATAHAQSTFFSTPSLNTPAPTEPDIIAMTFFRLAKAVPDFESWARQSDSVKNASGFEQGAALDAETARLKSVFAQISDKTRLTVETLVTLSEYNARSKGYFIQNFKSATFFPARYADRSFALVPQGIIDKQWIKVEDPGIVTAIETAARNSGSRTFAMLLRLTPYYADNKTPASIGGEAWWPLVVGVNDMTLYDAEKKNLLWQSDSGEVADKTRQSILNLYK